MAPIHGITFTGSRSRKSSRFSRLRGSEGAGDTIYDTPGSGHEDAVVVDLPAMNRLPRLTSTSDAGFLAAYVGWAAGKRPVSIHWNAAI